jgi:hypothetical protein
MSNNNTNNNGEERFIALSQYARDLECSRTETAPEVPYTENSPKCKDCREYFFMTLMSIDTLVSAHTPLKNLI